MDLDFDLYDGLEAAIINNGSYDSDFTPENAPTWDDTPINPFPIDQKTARAWVRGQI